MQWCSINALRSTKLQRKADFIKKSDVKFEDINISEDLVYLKLNEQTLKKQGSYKEVAGFLPTPKNGKEKHMTHPTSPKN